MSPEQAAEYMRDVDISIREACGGWIVVAPASFDDEGGLATDIHVFIETESVLEFVRQRMEWFKRERNKGSFDHGDDDYPGQPDNPVKPPRLLNTK